MADETQDEIQRRLLRLHGEMAAFAEERIASAEGLAALSLEAVRACAMRINGCFEAANAEFEEIKTKLAPGRSFSTH